MYKQRDGYDKFRVRDDGNTKTSGKAIYNEDGSLNRLDLIHPRGNGNGKSFWTSQERTALSARI